MIRVGGATTDTALDGDMDGQDFPELQRSDPSSISDWASDCAGPLAAASSVPEPTGLALAVAVVALALAGLGRRGYL